MSRTPPRPRARRGRAALRGRVLSAVQRVLVKHGPQPVRRAAGDGDRIDRAVGGVDDLPSRLLVLADVVHAAEERAVDPGASRSGVSVPASLAPAFRAHHLRLRHAGRRCRVSRATLHRQGRAGRGTTAAHKQSPTGAASHARAQQTARFPQMQESRGADRAPADACSYVRGGRPADPVGALVSRRLRKGGLSGSVLSVPHAPARSCLLTGFDLAARLALLLVVQTRRRRWPTFGRSHSGRKRTRGVLPSALSKSRVRGIWVRLGP
jgi:hypothetical protein